MATDLSQPTAPRRHPLITAIVVALVVILVALIGWIALRAVFARQQLSAAVPAAEAVMDGIRSGDLVAARSASAELKEHTAEATSLTSDPIWRLTEALPWAGPNFTAVRTLAAAADTVADQVLEPLLTVAAQADSRTLTISEGKIDLAPLVAAQPIVADAQSAFHQAHTSVSALRSAEVIAPVSSAVNRVDRLLARVAPTVDTISDTARVLPGMLGNAGPRNILVAAQNPAELRATGGLIGSMALIRADRGAIALVAQAAGTSIGPWETPVTEVPTATQGIFGPQVGRYLQSVNYTPDFPFAASTAAKMWERSRGDVIDGLITVDPVVLSAVLRVTGPVALPEGGAISADNAVRLLLSEVYSRYPEPANQDAFFASAAAAVFDRLSTAGLDGSRLVKELAGVGASDRLRIWSAHAEEQTVLAATSLGGGLPVSTPRTAALGVYFNDATGSKMDYYLSASVSAGAAVCRADGKPTSLVRVILTNRAPMDAAAQLPRYVTGGGQYGTPPGHIRTRVVVYGPAGGLLAGVRSGGADYSSVSGTDRQRPVAAPEIVLAPGESKTVEVEFLNVGQSRPGLSVVTTPTLPGDGSPPDMGMRTAVKPLVVPCPTP